VQAWSLDNTAEIDSDSPQTGRLLSVGLDGLVVVVAGALIFLAATLFSSRRSKPVEPKAQPTTTMPVAAPSPPAVTVTATPPPTVTVTAEPPAPPPLSTTDQQFLNAISDIAAAPSPAYAITHAHAVCYYTAQHPNDYTGTIKFVDTTTVWTAKQVYEFADVAMQVYCPSALPPGF
jgi:hypothetical protein